jgi:hypothetical protein
MGAQPVKMVEGRVPVDVLAMAGQRGNSSVERLPELGYNEGTRGRSIRKCEKGVTTRLIGFRGSLV